MRPMPDSLLVGDDLFRGDCGFRMDDLEFFYYGMINEIMTNNPGAVYGCALLKYMEGSLIVHGTTSTQPCLGIPGRPV